jgi:hypothetical protein
MLKDRRTLLLIVALILLNLWLNTPLFMRGELPYRGSVEGGYGGTSRFIAAHPNPWGWNPYQYCGVPTQFLYLPVLPYLTWAATHVLPNEAPEHLYRAVAALLACCAPASVFVFALYFTRSRKWALAAALAFTFVSPVYGMFRQVDRDRGWAQLPWRIQVMTKYGEGPHNVGLMLTPLALLALWLAGTVRRNWTLVLAAALLAAITLVNWISAFALAIACLLLLLAAIGERNFSMWRALAAAALGYLLACFWLTPSFIKTVAFNWPADSFGYRMGNTQEWLLAGLVAVLLLVRVFFWVRGGSFYFCFVTLCAIVFVWLPTGFYRFKVDTIPESRRYALELDLFLLLAVVEATRLILTHWDRRVRVAGKVAAAMMIVTGSLQTGNYIFQSWGRWRPGPKQYTVEHKLANWLYERRPEGRIFASGGLRFRLNAWFELAQTGGGFESGLRNRMPVHFNYRIRTGQGLRKGRENADTLMLLKTMGVEYVVVHGSNSREYYRDFVGPERLEGMQVMLHEDDDTIYRMPSPPPLAHLVSREELPPPTPQNYLQTLEPYVRAMEDPERPKIKATWWGNRILHLDGAAPAGRLMALKVNYDEGWRAMQNGRRIAIEPDNLGFMLLHAAPSPAAHIELTYVGTTEQRVFFAISACAWLLAAALLAVDYRGWRRSMRAKA